jgi:hypothetical protein
MLKVSRVCHRTIMLCDESGTSQSVAEQRLEHTKKLVFPEF